MKKDVFNTELSRMKFDNVRESTETLLEMLPDYFYVIPASQTKMHHPDYAVTEGGLVKHTKVAAKILEEIFRDETFGYYGDYQKDLMRMGILLHDGFKCGINYDYRTHADHPLLMSDFILKNVDLLKINEKDAYFVSRIIASHMGAWNKDENGREILPIPKTREEMIIHLCDYMSSRKFLNVDFEENEIVDGPKRVRK